MRSVRLDAETEGRLAEASRVTGQSISPIIRNAVTERCAILLDQRLDHRLADVIGIVSSDGARAEHSGDAFAELVTEQHKATDRVGKGRALAVVP